MFGRRNAPPLHGQIAVPADSPITKLEELAGQEVAFRRPGPSSATRCPIPPPARGGVEVRPCSAAPRTRPLPRCSPAGQGHRQQLDADRRLRPPREQEIPHPVDLRALQHLALDGLGQVPEKTSRPWPALSSACTGTPATAGATAGPPAGRPRRRRPFHPGQQLSDCAATAASARTPPPACAEAPLTTCRGQTLRHLPRSSSRASTRCIRRRCCSSSVAAWPCSTSTSSACSSGRLTVGHHADRGHRPDDHRQRGDGGYRPPSGAPRQIVAAFPSSLRPPSSTSAAAGSAAEPHAPETPAPARLRQRITEHSTR